jgi:hypothetical protein
MCHFMVSKDMNKHLSMLHGIRPEQRIKQQPRKRSSWHHDGHVENFLSDEDEDAVRSMEESSCSSSRSMMEHVESPFVAPTGVCLSHAVVELA